jgi:hypothetical protein
VPAQLALQLSGTKERTHLFGSKDGHLSNDLSKLHERILDIYRIL